MAIDRYFFRNLVTTCAIATAAGLGVPGGSVAYAAAPLPLPISPVPLALSTPAHPQVLFAIGNSESMDGTLSGAIMTGSGSLAAGTLGSLNSSSSPLQYAVPAGFTPPLDPGSLGMAPYTSPSGANLADNGASRLNVAKGGLQAILQTYMQNTDFALMDYKTSGTSIYTTWVYHISGASGFTFTNTFSAVNQVTNPCFNYTTSTSAVLTDCTAIAGHYAAGVVAANQYVNIAATSDEADINDVLYAGAGLPPVAVTYGGPSPVNPYTHFTLATYNSGGISEAYTSSVPGGAATTTNPTNAGYVPFGTGTEVMYSERGFGYGGSQTANAGNTVVPMATAGLHPTTASVNTAIALFTPHLLPETNNTGTSEIKSVAGQSTIAGLLMGAKAYLPGVPSGGGCNPKKYVILITDGLPTEDLAGKFWPPLGSAAGVGYGVTATFNGDGSLNTTNDQALTDTISQLAALNTAGINTYVVGLGAGVDPTLNPVAAATLTAMAVAGGTTSYFPATSPAALVSDLNGILISIQAGSLSTSAAAVNTTSLSTLAEAYQASFTAFDTPYLDWTGNLKAFAIDPVTGAINTLNPTWQAQAQLDTEASGSGWNTTRMIAAWNPTLPAVSPRVGFGAGAPFRWPSLSVAQQTSIRSTDTLAVAQSRLNYLRGDSSNERHNSGTFRNRSHTLGDIVDSAPVYVGTPSGPYADPSYALFETAQAARLPRLYVGANDGMVHGFDAATGNETMAFIPNGVVSNLYRLSDPLYNTAHQYFVNGSPQAADVQFSDATWHTILVGGEAGGGQTVYALDVTNPTANESSETNLANSVLWEFSDPDLGLTFGAPLPAPIHAATPNFAVFFGNGYNSTQSKPFLYAVNPQTGVIVRKVDLCAAVPTACNLTLANGLSGVAAANKDGIPGAPVDRVYAGDLQGNLWVINVSNASPASWTANVLFQARDPLNNRQAITTVPSISLNPNYPRQAGLMVFFGTGQFLTNGDLSTTQTQSFYGVWDNGTSLNKRANLQVQTITDVPGTPITRTVSSNTVDWTTQLGFYLDLPDTGERQITNSILVAGDSVFTTYSPSSNPCTPGGVSFLMAVNFKNGSAPPVPVFGPASAGQAGSSLGNVYATTPSAVGATSGSIIFETGLSTQTFNTGMSNIPVLQRVGWWQLQ